MPDTRCHRPGLEYTFNKLLGKHKYKINLGWYQKVCGFFFLDLPKLYFSWRSLYFLNIVNIGVDVEGCFAHVGSPGRSAVCCLHLVLRSDFKSLH